MYELFERMIEGNIGSLCTLFLVTVANFVLGVINHGYCEKNIAYHVFATLINHGYREKNIAYHVFATLMDYISL